MWIVITTLVSFFGFWFVPVDTFQGGFFAFLLAVTAFIGICVLLSQYFSHIDDLARLRLGEERIVIAEGRVNNLKGDFLDIFGSEPKLNEELLVRANKDNPISAMVEELASAERSVEWERERLVEARERIMERKIGPFKFLIKLFGDQ